MDNTCKNINIIVVRLLASPSGSFGMTVWAANENGSSDILIAKIYEKKHFESILLSMISLGEWFLLNDVSAVKFIDGEFIYQEEKESFTLNDDVRNP